MTNTHDIQAILFDADGVVIVPPHLFYHYTHDTLHIPREATDRYFTGLFMGCLRGQADLKETIAPFLPQWGWQGSVDTFLQTWFQIEHQIDERMVQHINQLRQRGIFCGLATNQEQYRVAYMKQQMGFATLFDGSFASCEVGALKMESQYFATVTQRLGLAPQQILFFDDSLRNVETARAFGWLAEQYTTFEAFQDSWKQFNLRLPVA